MGRVEGGLIALENKSGAKRVPDHGGGDTNAKNVNVIVVVVVVVVQFI